MKVTRGKAELLFFGKVITLMDCLKSINLGSICGYYGRQESKIASSDP
jgi:hypothetical protein